MLGTSRTQRTTFEDSDRIRSHAQVGDDLTVTNVTRVKKAIDDKACNAWLGQAKKRYLLQMFVSGFAMWVAAASCNILQLCRRLLLKVNQIGTVSESIDASLLHLHTAALLRCLFGIQS